MSEQRTIDKPATEPSDDSRCSHGYGCCCPQNDVVDIESDVFKRIERRNKDLWEGLKGDDAALLRALKESK